MPLRVEPFLIFAAAAVCCCGLSLTLERAFPANQKVDMEVLRARDRVRHSRILIGGVVDFNVAGSSDPYLMGLYFTKVKLGSPPREFNVQIDTGSDILWVTCSSCSDCPQLSGLGIELNFFDAASSSTASAVSCSDKLCASIVRNSGAGCAAQSNHCGYSFQYGDGSGTSGYYVTDLLYFYTVMGASMLANSSAPIIFGCSTDQSGDLTKPDRAIDGIFGFGQQELSVISQLSSRGITPKVFSHCLKGEGNGGGILVLGEILDPNIVYSPLVPSQVHYTLHLQSIAVNGQLLAIDPEVFSTSDNRGTIVDSGTTLAYLVEEAYDPLVNAITTLSQSTTPINSNGYPCYLASTSVSTTFPLVVLNFAGGASMVLRAEDYLVHYGFVNGAPMWCVGFQKVQGQGISILGDLVLKDKIFVYDLARQRIGWANYDCSSSVNVSIPSGKDEFINGNQLNVSSSSKFYPILKLIPVIITLLFANLILFELLIL